MLKVTPEAIKNVYKDIVFTEVPRNLLEHEYVLLNDILGPVI